MMGEPISRLSVDQYHRLIEMGILTEDDPVELLEGLLVLRKPHTPRYDTTVNMAAAAIRTHLTPQWDIRIHCAITTCDSEPEPDIAVVPGPPTRFDQHHPGATEIAQIVEVCDSALQSNRIDKGRVYACAGIVLYWIINLIDRQVEVYTDPTGPDATPAYRQRQIFGPGDSVPLIIDGKEVARIPVSDLLP